MSWGSEGEGYGQFKNPAGVALDVSEGSPGSGDGQFSEPEGIDVDSQGRVYVADTGDNRIQVFAQDSVLQTAGAERQRDGIVIL